MDLRRTIVAVLLAACPGCDEPTEPKPDAPEPKAQEPEAKAADSKGMGDVVAGAVEDAKRAPPPDTKAEAKAEPEKSGPYEGAYYDGTAPSAPPTYVESEPGDPKVVGCADGQREAFADVAAHPNIAGCLGQWTGPKSLRDDPTGKACGDDGETCEVPADACAAGWHVCGRVGLATDLTERTTQADCDAAGPGRFNAAMSHSPTDEILPCPTVTPTTKLPCVSAGLGSESICCGADCRFAKCKDAAWKGKTRISRGTAEGCGAVTSTANPGVLCCVD